MPLFLNSPSFSSSLAAHRFRFLWDCRPICCTLWIIICFCCTPLSSLRPISLDPIMTASLLRFNSTRTFYHYSQGSENGNKSPFDWNYDDWGGLRLVVASPTATSPNPTLDFQTTVSEVHPSPSCLTDCVCVLHLLVSQRTIIAM